MKIAITTVQAPFVSGGAEFHAENLKKALLRSGHEAEIVTIPFMDSTAEMIEITSLHRGCWICPIPGQAESI